MGKRCTDSCPQQAMLDSIAYDNPGLNDSIQQTKARRAANCVGPLAIEVIDPESLAKHTTTKICRAPELMADQGYRSGVADIIRETYMDAGK